MSASRQDRQLVRDGLELVDRSERERYSDRERHHALLREAGHKICLLCGADLWADKLATRGDA